MEFDVRPQGVESSLTIAPDVINITGNDHWLYEPSYTRYPYTILGYPETTTPATHAYTYNDSSFPEPISLKKAIFHDPATIVIWSDGSKTVVKVHGETYDPEKGLAMCFAKKVLGEAFHRTFREWCGGDE